MIYMDRRDKLIPVLTMNYGETARWLMEKYKDQFEQFRYSQNTMTLKDGTHFLMVDQYHKLLGLEFTEFLVSPHYTDLRLEAERRVQICKARTNGDPKIGDPS